MNKLIIYQKDKSNVLISLFGEKIHAGFESPASDYVEKRIDLNEYVSKHPESTYFARVVGDCMIGSGIHDDDLLVVDKSLMPEQGDLVVGSLGGDYILRAYYKFGAKHFLMPDNLDYKPIEITEALNFTLWGVVSKSILNQRRRNSDRIDRFEQLLR